MSEFKDNEWRILFWRLAEVLKCLPSSFVDGNEHVFRVAKAAMRNSSTTPQPNGHATRLDAVELTPEMIAAGEKVFRSYCFQHINGAIPVFEAMMALAPSPAAVEPDPAVKYSLTAEIERLKTAIRETLEENTHLADGDNCTLIKLKRALEPLSVVNESFTTEADTKCS
jgi:hypothetical protein